VPLTRTYLILAMVWCFFSCWPTTYVELAGIPLGIAFIAHAIRTPRFFFGAILQPVLVLLALYWAWGAISLAWSADPKVGLSQVGCVRWLWLFPALWPAMNRRRWLIGALVCGFLAGNLSQALHALGVRLDIHALTWPRQPDRNSGWWDPVVGGTLLTAAAGLHVPGAAFGPGRWRLLGAAGVAITLIAIFATGTRGAWIAAGTLVLVGAMAGTWAARARVRATAITLIGLVLVGVAVWIAGGDSIERRFVSGRDEVAAYFRDGTASTDTGARLMMAQRAVEAVREHPLRGVGVGGFRHWLAGEGTTPTESGHAHAHNALLHAAATTGIPGAFLALAAIVLAIYYGRRIARARPDCPYDAGPWWALLGLVLVSPFDSVQVNAQTAAMMTTLLALCPPLLPRPRPWPGRRQGAAA